MLAVAPGRLVQGTALREPQLVHQSGRRQSQFVGTQSVLEHVDRLGVGLLDPRIQSLGLLSYYCHVFNVFAILS